MAAVVTISLISGLVSSVGGVAYAIAKLFFTQAKKMLRMRQQHEKEMALIEKGFGHELVRQHNFGGGLSDPSMVSIDHELVRQHHHNAPPRHSSSAGTYVLGGLFV